MITRPIEINATRFGSDRDRAVLGVYQGGTLAAALGGVFGLYMTREMDLTRRERVVGGAGAIVTIGLGISAAAAPVQLAALLRRRVPPWALPAFGLVSIAGSGTARSPMFFPAVMLTALGGGRLGPPRIRTRPAEPV